MRSIFLRLKNSEPSLSDALHAIREIRIYNDLHGADALSAFEMAKGYSKPLLANQRPLPVDDELQKAHNELIAKRKLTLILRSNVYCTQSFKPGDFVQVYIKSGNEKRGKWTSPRQVLSINREAGSITVHDRAGNIISAAFEDCRAAPNQSELTNAIQESIDELEENLAGQLELHESIIRYIESTDEVGECEEHPGDFDMSSDNKRTTTPPNTGDLISVYWPLENKYFTGTVKIFNSDRMRVIHYDDDDQETLNLVDEQ